MKKDQQQTYLGDGLYAYDDGFMIILRAPRKDGEHWVGLEPDILENLFRFVARVRNLKISVAAKERVETYENKD